SPMFFAYFVAIIGGTTFLRARVRDILKVYCLLVFLWSVTLGAMVYFQEGSPSWSDFRQAALPLAPLAISHAGSLFLAAIPAFWLIQCSKYLQSAEDLYESAVETLDAKIIRKDCESVFLFGNTAFLREVGCSKVVDIRGKTDFDFYPEPLAERYRRDDQEVIRTGKGLSKIEEHPEKGRAGWVHVLKNPITVSGKVVGVQALYYDLTSYIRRIQDHTAKSQEFAHVGTWEYNMVSDKLTASRELYNIFGFSPHGANVDLKSFRNRVHPEDVQKISRIFEYQSYRDESCEEEFRIQLPNGSIKYIHARTDRMADDEGLQCIVVGVAVETTRLARSRHDYEDVFRNAADGICRTDEDGQHMLVNRSFARLFGFKDPASFQTAITNATQFYADPEDWKKLVALLRERDSVSDFCFYARERGETNGKRILVSQSVVKRKSDFGEKFYFNVVARSLEQEAESDERLMEFARQASTGALLAYPFHDVERVLKTALKIAQVPVVVDAEPELASELTRYCKPSLELLQLARDIRRGLSIDQYTQTLDLIELNNIWWQEHRYQGDLAKFKIEFAPQVSGPVHAKVVHRLIENLCVGVLKNVAAHAATATKIVWRVGITDAGMPFVEICDNGQGFPEKMLARDFGPLPWTSMVRSGFGIHLGVAKHIIENLHHGMLILSKGDLGGASVKMVLPAVTVNGGEKH
ncbi:MAG TPA: PAS domain S-box protein, partial [Clostridia bacterium]|nr:PAS domain S-box protein [Clostridia bacterium]